MHNNNNDDNNNNNNNNNNNYKCSNFQNYPRRIRLKGNEKGGDD